MAEDELIRLRQFAGWVMAAHTGTLDGWEIEDKAIELVLMTRTEEGASCGEGCECAEFGFPTDCCRPLLTPDGEVAALTGEGGDDGEG